mgnify:CR=1 FL=1
MKEHGPLKEVIVFISLDNNYLPLDKGVVICCESPSPKHGEENF